MKNKFFVFRLAAIFCLLSIILSGYHPIPVKNADVSKTALAKTKFDAKKAKKKIKATYKKTEEGIFATYKNNNSTPVKFSATVKFVDAAGTTLKKETITNLSFGKKKTIVYFFRSPKNKNNKYIVYNVYKASFSVSKSKTKDYTGKIKISTDLTPIACNIIAVNSAPKDLTSINATFYDKNGEFICAMSQNINCTKANTSQSLSIDYSGYPQTAKTVKVYKNWAY